MRWVLGIGALLGAVAVAVPAALPAGVEAAVSVPLRINAGGGEVTDSSGDRWQADRAYSSSAGWGYVEDDGVGGRAEHRQSIADTQDDAIFSSERWGMDAYWVDVTDGTYHVEILFAETYTGITGAGQRVFDVEIEGETAVSGLDVYGEAGFAAAVTREARDVDVTDGRLEITFSPDVEQPMIKGIAITAA
ncbi:MAG: malectin domain-containing carbohydrate-binding protein, partial [Dehalococcoidia bacterium]